MLFGVIGLNRELATIHEFARRSVSESLPG